MFNPPDYRKRRDLWPQKEPGKHALVILDLALFKKPCVLLPNDGTLVVPPPGVLFYATEAFPATIFETTQEAVDALQATLDWTAARGRPRTIEQYVVVKYAEHRASVEDADARRASVARARAAAKKETDDG